MAKEPFKGVQLSPEFTGVLTASEDDVDVLNHINNIVYLRWVQDIASAHSRFVGWDFAEYEAIGSVWVVRRHNITYLQSALAGDEIEMVTWAEAIRGASFTRKTQIFRQKDGAELARCETLWAFINQKTGRPTRMPPALIADMKKQPEGPVRLD